MEELMNNEEIMEESEVEETETKDLSGLICFGLGVAATFAGKYAIKGAKKLVKKIKDKKATSEDSEDEETDDSEGNK